MNTDKKNIHYGKREFPMLSFDDMDKVINERMERIVDEFQAGFAFLKDCEKTITIFGSARTKPSDPYYKKAHNIAERVVTELGYGVMTGGGPGIMGAGNCGAADGKGKSIGFTIKLPMEQTTNACVTDNIDFKYFFTRKVCMTYAAEAYVYFPGGFGTLDELFEILTLVQTKKIPAAPIILVGTEYFGDLKKYIDKQLLAEGMISPGDTDLFTITEDEDEILEIIKNAPVRKTS